MLVVGCHGIGKEKLYDISFAPLDQNSQLSDSTADFLFFKESILFNSQEDRSLARLKHVTMKNGII